MATRIDFDRSIASGRLKWKRDRWGLLELVYNYFMRALIISIFLIGPIQLIVQEVKAGTIGELSTAFYVGIISIGLIALGGTLVIDKLKRGIGLDSETNRVTITKILDREYPNINKDATGIKILAIRKPLGQLGMRFGERVIVIFHDRYIYINIITILAKDVHSIFHALHNYYKAKAYVKEFEEESRRLGLS